ncbi:MAG: RNA polymerase sigma-54 factor, partial [Planctomycetota bacterium]|nr:RNA polymerase sigma-54 factor [Planctomycetota bacterium]
MHLGLGQHLKMSQQMKLAPRMIQSMEILQLPLLELKERIEQELIENPLLEDLGTPLDAATGEAPDRGGGDNGEMSAPATEKPLEQKELTVDNDHNNQDDFERLSEMGDSWQDDESFSPRVSGNRMDEEGDRALDQMANIVSRPPSLQEHLLEQIHFFNSPFAVRAFAEYLVQNLDQHGRLTGALDELLRSYTLEFAETPVTPEEAEAALSLVQRLDPPGVGARDLKECFLLQLKPHTPYRDVLVTLITSHLEDLAENRLPVIERRTGYDRETIKAAREELLQLNPHPGRDFEYTPTHNVVPDLFVEPDDHGQWKVRIEDEYTPRLNISRKYQQMLASGTADAQTKEYIKKKIESAKWLIESIEQRYSTLRRVAQAIVDHQTAFLMNGPEHIVPL